MSRPMDGGGFRKTERTHEENQERYPSLHPPLPRPRTLLTQFPIGPISLHLVGATEVLRLD